MSILDRIRANGGDVTRDKWRMNIRPGRMTPAALSWLKSHRDDLMREIWPEFDDFEERAAIREFDGGQTRVEAEQTAYEEIAAHV